MIIIVPEFERQGQDAAVAGVGMSAPSWPLGFTFCPHQSGSVERYNFLRGCVRAYFGGDERIQGELV